MKDTITQTRSGEDIDLVVSGRDLQIFDVEWDEGFREELADTGEVDGIVYGNLLSIEFLCAWYGNLKITRDMLVLMTSEAEVQALEYSKLEQENGY